MSTLPPVEAREDNLAAPNSASVSLPDTRTSSSPLGVDGVQAVPSKRHKVTLVISLLALALLLLGSVGVYVMLSQKPESAMSAQEEQSAEEVLKSDEQIENETLFAKDNAKHVQVKARAYRVVMHQYPTFAQLLEDNQAVPEAWLGSRIKELMIQEVPTAGMAEKIQYKLCSPAGGVVVYYDGIARSTVALPFGNGCDT